MSPRPAEKEAAIAALTHALGDCATTVRVGATAPQSAGMIHTDFERGFIRAEVIAFPDYIAGKGEAGAREAGKLRLEGKDYVVQEGDVLRFRFNV